MGRDPSRRASRHGWSLTQQFVYLHPACYPPTYEEFGVRAYLVRPADRGRSRSRRARSGPPGVLPRACPLPGRAKSRWALLERFVGTPAALQLSAQDEVRHDREQEAKKSGQEEFRKTMSEIVTHSRCGVSD